MDKERLSRLLLETRYPSRKLNLISEKYEWLFEKVQSEVGKLGINAQIVLCNSIERRCSVVFDGINGDVFICYDEYLSETLNVLNRVFFLDKTADDSLLLMMKYMGENFRINGDLERGLWVAMYFESVREIHKKNKLDYFPPQIGDIDFDLEKLKEIYSKEDPEPDLPSALLIQEAFILYHEVGHLYIDIIKKTNDNLYNKLIGKGSRYIKNNQLVKFLMNNTRSLFPKQINARYKSVVSEELFCDRFAFENTVSLLSQYVPYYVMVRSVWLLLYHLKLLKRLDYISLPEEKRQQSGWGDSAVRAYYLNEYYGEFKASYSQNKHFKEKSFNLSLMNNRHKACFDEVMEQLDLHNLIEEAGKKLPPLPCDRGLALRNIDYMLEWSPKVWVDETKVELQTGGTNDLNNLYESPFSLTFFGNR